ncbi:uncharacterized protein [Rutidosis leptorrhynchoides]|uniref:uncharacterized protein n=1 Tax=Rutidosis leptorrhynchoides TaxID=125765 RepID=UPI003A9A44B6
MESPAKAVEVVEKFEDGKDKGPLFHCELSDKEIVRKIAQMFLPGLATACVDNTSGDIFKTPASVAVDIRTEMVNYLTQRSESFIAESVILEGETGPEVSDHPYDILSDFVDDFASLKRNLFSRVSGWLLSDKREDKIDDVVQEMERNGFWLMDKREAIARLLLKNVDFKEEFHCSMKFNSKEEVAEHVLSCGFRPLNCMNEGCNAIFCASQLEKHDSACPFKIIPCEQNCSESLMRREMDKHCITVCPMKLVNCPFYAVGCESSIPYCQIEQHRLEDFRSHVIYVLKGIHKKQKGVSLEDLKNRVQQLEDLSPGRLAEARNSRSLTNAVKDLESKLGPLEISTKNKDVEEDAEDGQGKDLDANLEPSSESSAENKEIKKDAENKQVKDLDSNLEPSSESSAENKEIKKDAENNQVKDNDATVEPSEISLETKEARKETDLVKKEAKDDETERPEVKVASSEIRTTNKEAEKVVEKDQVDDHGAKLIPSEFIINKDAEKDQVEDADAKLGSSERERELSETPSLSKTEENQEREATETQNDKANEETKSSSDEDEKEHRLHVKEETESSSDEGKDDDKEEIHRTEASNLTADPHSEAKSQECQCNGTYTVNH